MLNPVLKFKDTQGNSVQMKRLSSASRDAEYVNISDNGLPVDRLLIRPSTQGSKANGSFKQVYNIAREVSVPTGEPGKFETLSVGITFRKPAGAEIEHLSDAMGVLWGFIYMLADASTSSGSDDAQLIDADAYTAIRLGES